ncbi:14465_t:CDS:2, partial [Funneliformis caledonium]
MAKTNKRVGQKKEQKKNSEDIPIFDKFDIIEEEKLDEKTDNFVKILSNGMKNYVLPAHRSICTENSIQIKKRKKAEPCQSDQEIEELGSDELCESNSEFK